MADNVTLSSFVALLRIQLRLMVVHRVDSVSALLSLVLYGLISVIIYAEISADSVNLPQILFVAGLLRIAWGFVESVTESLWSTGYLAKSGELLYFMLSPLSTLLHLMFSKIHFERLGDVIWGISFIGAAFALDPEISLDMNLVVGSLVTILSSMAIFFSVILFGAAANIHWLSETGLLMSATVQVAELGLYPGRLFLKMLGRLTVLVVPIFTSGVIGEFLLFGFPVVEPGYRVAILIPWCCLLGSCLFWRHVIGSYQGTGS